MIRYSSSSSGETDHHPYVRGDLYAVDFNKPSRFVPSSRKVSLSLSLSFLLRPLPLITYFTFFKKIFIYDVLICFFIWVQNLSVCWYFISISCVLKFERKVRKWVKHMWHISENMAGIGTARFQISMSKFPTTIFSNILLYIYILFFGFCIIGTSFTHFRVQKSRERKKTTYIFVCITFIP